MPAQQKTVQELCAKHFDKHVDALGPRGVVLAGDLVAVFKKCAWAQPLKNVFAKMDKTAEVNNGLQEYLTSEVVSEMERLREEAHTKRKELKRKRAEMEAAREKAADSRQKATDAAPEAAANARERDGAGPSGEPGRDDERCDQHVDGAPVTEELEAAYASLDSLASAVGGALKRAKTAVSDQMRRVDCLDDDLVGLVHGLGLSRLTPTVVKCVKSMLLRYTEGMEPADALAFLATEFCDLDDDASAGDVERVLVRMWAARECAHAPCVGDALLALAREVRANSA